MQKLHLIMQNGQMNCNEQGIMQNLGLTENLRFAENESKNCYADGRMKKLHLKEVTK